MNKYMSQQATEDTKGRCSPDTDFEYKCHILPEIGINQST